MERIEDNPDDLAMVVTGKGFRVEIYDTYCKNFTEKDKEIFDEKINDIIYRSMLRKQMALERGSSESGA